MNIGSGCDIQVVEYRNNIKIDNNLKVTFKILNNFPRATYCTLDKAGHEVQIEQEKIFNLLVKEWIYRLEENIE